MSCYLRHLKPLFGKVGITPETKEERKRIDLAIRTVVGKSADNPLQRSLERGKGLASGWGVKRMPLWRN